MNRSDKRGVEEQGQGEEGGEGAAVEEEIATSWRLRWRGGPAKPWRSPWVPLGPSPSISPAEQRKECIILRRMCNSTAFRCNLHRWAS